MTTPSTLVFNAAGPYFIAAIGDDLVWCDSRMEDGAFETLTTTPHPSGVTIDELPASEGFDLILTADLPHDVAVLRAPAHDLSFSLYVTAPERSGWDLHFDTEQDDAHELDTA